ncbi:MAG: hypothetical protein C4548_15145 [Desulfobacteraceae bacterium]|jgi:hypothetical protein|nr:MAG: hypothetical protein C4548_15145 [Desulfobacteraceae bacterium]
MMTLKFLAGLAGIFSPVDSLFSAISLAFCCSFLVSRLKVSLLEVYEEHNMALRTFVFVLEIFFDALFLKCF